MSLIFSCQASKLFTLRVEFSDAFRRIAETLLFSSFTLINNK